MQWLAEVCVKRPVFAIMLIAALVVAGTASYGQLGVARYPLIDTPQLYVRAVNPGASPMEMESEVAQLMEDAVGTVEGIDELRSICGESFAMVIAYFDLDRNIHHASQDVREALDPILDDLPPGTEPPQIFRRDSDSSPVMTLVVSGPRDPRELYVLADKYVKRVIESVRGVGEVEIDGTMERAIQVNIDADRLAAYGLSIMQVREALSRQNAEIPTGLMQSDAREVTLRLLGRVERAREFEDLVVATVNGTAVRLRDVGDVVDGQKDMRNQVRLDGVPAVVLQIQKQTGANTVKTVDGVKERLDRVRQLLPNDVHVEINQDQSEYIVAAMHEIQKHLISGSLLASLVVLLFMKSWRSAVIAAVAIPTSIIATFAAMRAMGFTLNNVTMLALVLMVGVVIDDAVIVLENIFHWIEEKDISPREAAVKGTKEIGLAVLATTLSLVIVFLPVSFMSTVTGRMLYEFGVTATFAILVSMLVSFSLTPMMCSRMLRRPRALASGTTPNSRGGFYRLVESAYVGCLKVAMRNRWAVVILSGLVLVSNVWLYGIVNQDYIPTDVDESEFEIRVTAPNGTSMVSMDAAMKQVEARVREVDGIKHVLTEVGSRSRVNSGELFIKLNDISTRTWSFGRIIKGLLAGNPMSAFEGNFSQSEKKQEIRSVLKEFPDLRASVRNLTSFRQGAPVDIDFSITGPTLDGLHEYALRLMDKLEGQPGIVDTDITLKLDKPELLVHIDRERAAALGVDVQEIAETLRVAVGGDQHVSRYRDTLVDDSYDVELRLVGIDRSDPQSISQLYVRSRAMSDTAARIPASTHVRLDNVVDFEETQTASRIDRLDRERMVAFRCNVDTGYALTDAIATVQREADALNLPLGYNTSVRGRGRELERTLADFGWTFVLSFVFMYIVLAAQFEHLVHPLTILFSLPLAVPFGLLSLWLGGESLNLYSALGILVLFGVVKKASILQVDHTNQLRARGMGREEAILTANRDRLRPILMTTISFVAGMFPLLIGVGPGAEERRSIAVLAVGGQTLSLLLTLLAVPVVYSLLDDAWRLFRGHGNSTLTSAKPPAQREVAPTATS